MTTLAEAIAQTTDGAHQRDRESALQQTGKDAQIRKRLPIAMSRYVASRDGLIISPNRWKITPLPRRQGYTVELLSIQNDTPHGEVFFDGTISADGGITQGGWRVESVDKLHLPHLPIPKKNTIRAAPHGDSIITVEYFQTLVQAAMAAGMAE